MLGKSTGLQGPFTHSPSSIIATTAAAPSAPAEQIPQPNRRASRQPIEQLLACWLARHRKAAAAGCLYAPPVWCQGSA